MLNDGIVVIDKPSGPTSHDIVAKCRKIFNTRKVGHAGTLDPMASGVLIVGIGKATRLLGYISDADKSYQATIRLGQATTTDDAQGEVISTMDASGIAKDTVLSVIREFRGHISQRPSSVSAIKVNGERAYARVRKGEDVVLPEREVTIHDLQVLDVRPVPESACLDVDIDVSCSSGTYIRALARDIGAQLAVGGHLTQLRRTRIGTFSDMVTLAQLEVHPQVIPVAKVAERVFPVVTVTDEQAQKIRHGIRIPAPAESPETIYSILDSHRQAVAIAETVDDLIKTHVVFADE